MPFSLVKLVNITWYGKFNTYFLECINNSLTMSLAVFFARFVSFNCLLDPHSPCGPNLFILRQNWPHLLALVNKEHIPFYTLSPQVCLSKLLLWVFLNNKHDTYSLVMDMEIMKKPKKTENTPISYILF